MSDKHSPAEPEGKPNGKHPGPAFEPRKRRKGRGANRRRSFTAAYKLRVLEEVDALGATGEGQVAEILRREGLYSSHLSNWRKQRDRSALAGLSATRGRKADPDQQLRRELAALRAENERLQTKLAKAQAVIEVQKKLCDLLEFDPNGSNS